MKKVSTIKKRFGDQVRCIRLSRNMTQEDLAHKLDLEDSRQIRAIENGEVFVNLKTVARLSIALDTHLKEFFDFELF